MNDGLPVIPEAGHTAEERIWGPWATLGLGAVVLAVFFAVMVFIAAVVAVVLVVGHPGAASSLEGFMDIINAKLGLVIAVAGIGSYIAGTVLIFGVIKVRRGQSVADYLSLKRVGWRTLLVLLGITGAYLVLVTVIASMTKIQEEETGILAQAYNTSVWPPLFWVTVVIFAPIFEEPLGARIPFRRFPSFASRPGRGRPGDVAHLDRPARWLHCISLGAIFGFGIILGFMRYRTGSLWSTMLMHAFFQCGRAWPCWRSARAEAI